ncbi:MAG: tetratricopeptide repeat protein [Bacteroidota bacterium]
MNEEATTSDANVCTLLNSFAENFNIAADLSDEEFEIQHSNFSQDPLLYVIDKAKGRLEPDDFSIFFSSFVKYRKGFTASQSKNYQAAEKMFAEAERISSSLKGEARHLLTSLSYPNIAFYEYAQKNYDKADELLLKTLDSDDKLADAYGVIHAHKIHILHNVARVKLKSGQTQSGISLFSAIFAYLFESKYPMNTGIWGEKPLNSIWQYVSKEDMFWAVFSDLIMHQVRDDNTTKAIRECTDLLSTYLNKRKYTSESYNAAYQWIHIESKYQDDQIEDFINGLSKFIHKFGPKYGVLKVSMIQNYLRLTHQYIPHDHFNIKNTVVSFVKSKIPHCIPILAHI